MTSKKMLIAASLQLFDIITKLLFTDDKKERELPTLTKLALVQNRDNLAGDILLFRQDVASIKEELGISSETVENLTPEQNEQFEEKIKKALARVVEHTFVPVSREDLEYINDIQFTTEDLSLIAATLLTSEEAAKESSSQE